MSVASIHSLDRQIASGFERLQTVYRNLFQTKATHLRLTPLQLQILYTLRIYPGGISLKGLSRYLKLTMATLSDAVRVLERKRLVRKKAVAKDKRFINLKLIPKAARLLGRSNAWASAVKEGMAYLKQKEKVMLLGALIRMITQLRNRGIITVARMCVLCGNFRRNVRPGRSAPHYCVLSDTPIGNADLKTDCPMFLERTLSVAQ